MMEYTAVESFAVLLCSCSFYSSNSSALLSVIRVVVTFVPAVPYLFELLFTKQQKI